MEWYAWSDHGGWDAEILHPIAQPSAVRLLPIRWPPGAVGHVPAWPPCEVLGRSVGLFGARVSVCRSAVIDQIQSAVNAGVDRYD